MLRKHPAAAAALAGVLAWAVNFNDFLMGGTPSVFQAGASILCLAVWLRLAFHARGGRKRRAAAGVWFGAALLTALNTLTYSYLDRISTAPELLLTVVLEPPLAGLGFFFRGIPATVLAEALCFLALLLTVLWPVRPSSANR